MTEAEVIERLKSAARPSASAWARDHGLSPSYVGEVLRREKPPGESVLAALGLERIVSYRRREDAGAAGLHAPRMRNGIALLPRRAAAPDVTLEIVNALRDESP
ncbi:MAG TPA: hypothetical protein VG248_05085 [Caulobacteraceae bacterium]|jgi:hypothetical protein|nr:hypothetical protein [Caulobacteraceae bacterium]